MSVRKLLFWVHLVAGLISGLSIGIMCFTGAVLAFEKEIVAWAERDARRVEPPANAPRLPLDELQRRLREAEPEARAATIVVQNDPRAAVAFSAGRDSAYHVNPYTGEVRQPQSTGTAKFMHTMVDLHRYLGFHGDISRPRGKLINGICNVAFFALAVTGLYLWWPRSWSWRGVKAVAIFNWRLTGKARDFNWHNAIGLWSAPVLIVLTLTAMPISFRWAGNLIYTLTGTPAPAPGAAAPGGGGAGVAPAMEVPKASDGAHPLPLQTLLANVQKEMPAWQQITLRLGESRLGSAGLRSAPTPQQGGRDARSPSAVTFAVREHGTWPRTATTTLSLDPFTGGILRRSGYAEMNAAQQVRSWTRFLHTGEALGWTGQLVAGLASLGGVVLVYSGFALAWRRFFGKQQTLPRVASSAGDPERAPEHVSAR